VENKEETPEEIQEEKQESVHADFDPNVVIFACRH
jgi:hypothetical protein